MQIYQRVPAPGGGSRLAAFDPAAAPDICDLTQPTLYFLPGVLTTDGAALPGQSAEESLAHKSALIERHLGGPEAIAAGVRQFSLTYSSSANYWTGGRWAASRFGRSGDGRLWAKAPNDYFSEDAKRLVDSMLLPALAEPMAAGDVAGVKARLAHLTLFGDSYGSIFAEQMANVLQRAFRGAGFAEGDVQDMLSAIHVLAACNMPLRHGENRMTGVYFEARNDAMIDSTRPGPPPGRLAELDPAEAARHARAVSSASRWSRLADSAANYGGLARAFFTSAGFSELSAEETAALAARTAEPYAPASISNSDVWVERVNNGAVVTFRAPAPVDVLLEGPDGVKGRRYNNDMGHNSFGYYYPVPGQRDHVDLLARALTNMLRRAERDAQPSIRALLSTPAEPYGAADPSTQAAIDQQLSEVLDLSGRRERDERFTGAGDAGGRVRFQDRLAPRAQASGWTGGR